jgi:fibronectin-binding autotransporter adhesin
MSNKCCVLILTAAILILAGAQRVWAVDADGQWLSTVTSTGDWSVADNWIAATIANGDGYTAYFMGDTATGNTITVNVDPARATESISHLFFYDYTPDTPGKWVIQGNTVLNLVNTFTTLNSEITVNPVFTDPSETVRATTAEISSPVSVASGTGLVIQGGGILKLSGNTTVLGGNATIQTSTVVDLSGNMTVNTGNVTVSDTSVLNVTGSLSTTSSSAANGRLTINGGNVVNVSGTGSLTIAGSVNAGTGNSLNIGLSSGDAVTATLRGGDTTIQYGDPAAAALSNSGWGASTITVRGTTTVSTTGAVVDEVRIGSSGPDAAALAMYDNSVLNTALLRVSEFGDQALVNLYNNARINATTVEMAHWHDPSVASNIRVTLNNSSKLYATDVTVGNSGSAVLVVNDNAEVHVAGTLYTARNGYWGSPSLGVTGEVDVSGNGKIFAGAISLDGNWTTTRSTSVFNLTDNALVSVTGNMMLTNDEPSNAYVNMSNNAQLNVGGALYVAGTASSQGTATLSVTCNPGETASVTANSMVVGGPNWNEIGTFNLSGNAKATITNNLGIAMGRNADGYVNVSDNAQLQVGSITMSPSGGGSGANTRQLNIYGAAQVTSTGDLTIGATTGWTRTATVTVSGASSLTIGGNVNAPGDGGVTLNDSATMSVAGNYTIGEPVNNNYFTMNVTGGGTSTATSLTVGGNIILSSTNGTLLANSIGGGAPPNGGVQLTGAGSTLYFNGGRIQPGAATTAFMQGLPHAIIQAGGAKFAVYQNVTVAQDLEHDSALGSTADGGLAVSGNSTLTLSGALTYTGPTTINATSTLKIDSPGTTALAAVSGTGNLTIGDGIVGNTVSVASVNVGTLNVGDGSTVVIRPLPGGPLAGGGLTAVPEPGTLALLSIAAMGLIGAAWRKRK